MLSLCLIYDYHEYLFFFLSGVVCTVSALSRRGKSKCTMVFSFYDSMTSLPETRMHVEIDLVLNLTTDTY